MAVLSWVWEHALCHLPLVLSSSWEPSSLPRGALHLASPEDHRTYLNISSYEAFVIKRGRKDSNTFSA